MPALSERSERSRARARDSVFHIKYSINILYSIEYISIYIYSSIFHKKDIPARTREGYGLVYVRFRFGFFQV